jgi:hypothetical protein
MYSCQNTLTVFRASSSRKEQSLLPAAQPLDGNDPTGAATKQRTARPALENADSASGEPTLDFAFNIPVPGMYEIHTLHLYHVLIKSLYF